MRYSGTAIEKAVRRAVPSTARLTYNPAVKVILRAADIVPAAIYREFRRLPPNHLRVRVGVHNRPFTNQVAYMRRGFNIWLWALAEGHCDMMSTIVEIGCGCGRRTHVLRDYQFAGVRYSGRYYGVDIDGEMLEWCRNHFDSERFTFLQSTHRSEAYASSETPSRYRLPLGDGSVDFFFGTSVLSHLLEDDLRNYLEEGARVLRHGRVLAMSCYCIDYPPDNRARHAFAHRIGEAYVESMRVPEAAVGYSEEFLFRAAKEAGFTSADLHHAPGNAQHYLICRR